MKRSVRLLLPLSLALAAVGVHEASSKLADGTNWVDRPVLISPLPGVAYYNLLPGPGMPERRTMDMVIANAAMDVGLGRQVRLGAEYAVRQLKDMDRGVNSSAGYVSLRRRSGAWTPYVYYAWLRSDQDMVDLYHAVNCKRVPAWVPQADLINLSQRATADGLEIHDQQTWAVGSAYALTPSGAPVIVVNAPPGSPVRNRFLNTYVEQDEERYVAYWTVHRFIGKGLPSKEMDSAAAVIEFVQKTPGAIGYVDAAELRPGLNVLARQ